MRVDRYEGPAAHAGPHLPYLSAPNQGGTTGSLALEQHVPTTAIRGLSTGALTRRMLMGAVLAVLGFAVAYQVAVAVADAGQAMAVVFASGAALVVGAAVMSRTISPIVAGQAELQVRYEAALADALRDPLTGLGNHRAFHEELDRQVEGALRYGTPLALMLIDLDEFKSVNDSCGHAAGDECLREAAERIGDVCRGADLVARIGGDEFAVILGVRHSFGDISETAAAIVAEMSRPVPFRGRQLQLGASVGVALVDDCTPSQLFVMADAALYAAKDAGRGTFRIHKPGSGPRSSRPYAAA
jgi:diguanylate cyclase (GGDEF)-like protein